ncbi:MAG: helicase C-terminal domain-containing protein [Promethearchaeota archaeon]|jgi:Rad3-related DNA helicase
MSNFNYKNFFPYSSIRSQQKDAIDFALENAINNKKKFIVLEMGTGCGKSAVGLTISRYIKSHFNRQVFDEEEESGAYFLTTQKILQEQYVKDFGKKNSGPMRSIKSSANYSCKNYLGNTCQETRSLVKATGGGICFQCPYQIEKTEFMESKESITNYPFFLTSVNFAKTLKNREVIVIDEAHNIETELSKFVEINVSEKFSKTLGIKFPEKETAFQAIKWIREVYHPKAKSHLKFIKKKLETDKNLQKKVKELKNLSDQIERLNMHVEKIEGFVNEYDADNWVFNLVPAEGYSLRKFNFKPISIAKYADSLLFSKADHVILLSATIINGEAFCETLGIDKNDYAFLSIPSPFPKENRPVLSLRTGRMSQNYIDKSLPDVVKTIKAILEEHKDEKGIIHTHTYKIANYIKKNIRNKRLLIHGSNDREDMLEYHLKSKEPTVLLSPSMTEGVDLNGDLSRFQIICKVPYPYLGDKLTRKRMNKWSWWYPMQTAKIIIQSVGRSIRDENDSAITYILDEDWEFFLRKNKKMLPASFLETLIV